MAEDPQAKILRDIKTNFRKSAVELAQWKLYKSAKWSSEALKGMLTLPPQDQEAPDRSYLTSIAESYTPTLNTGFTTEEFDTYLLASSLFDCKEYDRCAFFLKGAREPRLKFLKLYASYLSWDKKSLENSETVLMLGKVPSTQARKNLNLNDDSLYTGRPSQVAEAGVGTVNMENGHQSSIAIMLRELREYLRGHTMAETAEEELGFALLYYLKGILLSRSDNKPQAITNFLRSLSLYSFNWACWTELLECIGRADESVLLLRHLSENFNFSKWNNIGSQSVATTNILINFFKLSVFQEFSGNVEDFLENLGYLLDIFPDFTYLRAQNALVYYNHMDYANSESMFDQAIKSDPYRLEDLDVYSNILYVMQKQTKLSHLAQLVSQIDRFRPESCCIVANYYSARQEHEKSIMYFRRALMLNKRLTSAWTLMGHEFVELKNSQAAIECYRRGISINPRDFKAWYGLGQAYEVLDMHMYSLYYFQKACTLKPLDRRMWQAVGDCYAKLKNANGATKCYERALELSSSPDQEQVLCYRLAIQYELALDFEKAKLYMLKCIDISGEDGLAVEEHTKAKLWLAKYELKMKNYDAAYNYAVSITAGSSQDVDEARTIARNCRMRTKR